MRMASWRVSAGYPFTFGPGVYLCPHSLQIYFWLPDPLNPFFTCLICVLQFGHFISPFYIAFTLGTLGKNIPAHRGIFVFDSLFLMWWIQGFVA